jgi:hypothetical protein
MGVGAEDPDGTGPSETSVAASGVPTGMDRSAEAIVRAVDWRTELSARTNLVGIGALDADGRGPSGVLRTAVDDPAEMDRSVESGVRAAG